MFSGGLTRRQSEDPGNAGGNPAAGVEILDVSQMLLTAVRRGDPDSTDSPALEEVS